MKHSQSTPWQATIEVGGTLARWRIRIRIRMLKYLLLHTLHGKLGFFGGLIMLAMFAPAVIGGFLDTLPVTRAGLDGLLLVAHLWLAGTLALMILAQFAKEFLKNREQEPLGAHPAHFPALARHRVIAAMPHTTFGFVGLFFAYFWKPMAARLDHLWLGIAVHLITTALLAFVSAIVIGGLGRKLLPWASRRSARNPDLVVNLTGGAAMTVFIILLAGIVIVNKHAEIVFQTLGNSVAVSFPIGMIPFAAALAADEGRWLTLVGWLGLSGVLALWALRAAYHWSFSAHREIPIDLATPVRRTFAPVFTGLPNRWLPSGVCAFWRKDIVVPYSREPKRYLFHLVNLLWWGVLSVILAMALRNRGNISAAFADTVPVLMTLLAVVVFAMQNGVNALGREGKEFTRLRPILTGWQLLSRKLLVNWTYALVHGVAFALVVHTASQTASMNTSIWTLFSYAVGAGCVFTGLATSVGFLLPDFERRSSSLPGATALGRFGFLLGALVLIGITGVAHLLLAARMIDGGFCAGMLTFAALCATVAMTLIALAAIRQYRGIEI